MFSIRKNKQPVPFAKLFRVTTPKDFVILFSSELVQTKAFILSFSPSKGYVKKVIHLLDIEEKNEEAQSKSSFSIREYLNRCQEDTFNLAFVQAVEKEVESMIAGYEDFHDLRKLRKRLLFKHPAKVQTEIKEAMLDDKIKKGEYWNKLIKKVDHLHKQEKA